MSEELDGSVLGLVTRLEDYDVDQGDTLYVADEHSVGFSVVVRVHHEMHGGERRVVLVTRRVEG